LTNVGCVAFDEILIEINMPKQSSDDIEAAWIGKQRAEFAQSPAPNNADRAMTSESP
jgi:hypothetical protein